MRSLLPLILALHGCSRAAPRPSGHPPVERSAAPVDRIALLRSIAGGQPLGPHIDPALGLLLLEHVEAGPGPDARPTRRASRACELRAGDGGAVALIRAALSQSESFGVACEGAVCTVPGMEHAPAYRFVFAGDGLSQILRLSEAALSAEALRERDAFVASQVSAQRSRPCRGAPR